MNELRDVQKTNLIGQVQQVGQRSQAGAQSNHSHTPAYEQQGVAMTCRSYAEYLSMFALEEENLADGPILDVAAGASSFVAEANRAGVEAYAVDPLYELTADEIARKGMLEIEESTAKIDRLRDHFDWTYYGDVTKHRANRERSLTQFIADFREHGASRYVAAFLPNLPFADDRFSLVLCSHFLFLYGEQFGQDFHEQAIRELLRICRPGGRVLVYPLKTLKWDEFPGLSNLIEDLEATGVRAELLPSQLPFIPGSTMYLSLCK